MRDEPGQVQEPPSVGFARAPHALRARLGARGAGRFRLRRGDFIEDRFGVEQRDLMVAMRDEPLETQLDAFDWFGSYMLEEVVDEMVEEQVVEEWLAVGETADGEGLHFGQVDQQGLVTWVEHIDGRGKVPPSERRPPTVPRGVDGRAPRGRWGAEVRGAE